MRLHKFFKVCSLLAIVLVFLFMGFATERVAAAEEQEQTPKEVLAEEGDVVERGQVLVRLVDDELKLSEAEARIQYQKLESQFRRKEEMFSRKLLSNEEYEQQRFDLDQARVVWQKAQLALNHAAVRSPVPGVM